MSRYVVVLALTFVLAAPSIAADDPLTGLIRNYRKQPHTPTAPVTVTAVAAIEGEDIVLRFRLTNTSKKTLRFYPTDFPWGGIYSISWAAITSAGDVLPLGYPIQDNFGMDPEVPLLPGETREGTYKLSWMLPYDAVPAETDLIILWSYDLPPRPVTGIVTEPSPICTGVAFVRSPKHRRQGA